MKPPKISPLIYPAAVLSAASLAWTTWSLVDLLGTGLIGLTVAAGADIIWGSVILAEARGLRIAGRRWPVLAIGWAALVVVAVFLVWHGIDRNLPAMAFAGPLLPLGAKVVWILALADMRDPAALTDEEQHQLSQMERGLVFEEAKHRIQMRTREMHAELQMGEVSTDFDIEIMRQDKARELHRRRPLELEPAKPPISHADGRQDFASAATATSSVSHANVAGQDTARGEVFGFAAALRPSETQGEISQPRQAKDFAPRKAKTLPSRRAKEKAKQDPRAAAVAAYRASVAEGQPLTGADLGRLCDRTPRWGQQIIAEMKND